MGKNRLTSNPGSNQTKSTEKKVDYDFCTKYLLSDIKSSSSKTLNKDSISTATPNTMGIVSGITYRIFPDEQDASDTRRPISQSDLKPWSAICSLRIRTERRSFIGTGFFIGAKTILTAGHNVYNHAYTTSRNKSNYYAKEIEIYPGRYYDNLPFPTEESAIKKPIAIDLSKEGQVFVADSWLEYGEDKDDHDYAIIRLALPVGSQTGWLDLSVVSDDFIRNKTIHMAGYPKTVRGDKVNGNLLYHDKNVMSEIDEHIIYHQIDGSSGQSGSPIWYQGSNDKPQVVGIHTGGSTKDNTGLRITEKVNDLIQSVLL